MRAARRGGQLRRFALVTVPVLAAGGVIAADLLASGRTTGRTPEPSGSGFLSPAVARRAHVRPVGQIQVPTTLEDFFQPGTQPDPSGSTVTPIISSLACSVCHGEYLDETIYHEPWDGWVASMMGQSTRDPVWHAALAIANQDAAGAGEFCIRCHSPGAWLAGRSVSGTTDDFIVSGFTNDFDGVNCHFCHRLVNPVLEVDSPAQDEAILAALAFPPGTGRGNGRFVVDPANVRRGPYLDIAENPAMNMHGVPVIYSPFHHNGEMCMTCHDVMNPLFMKQPDGTYALAPLDAPHPTQDPYDMFPEQTTASEWAFSAFANGGVAFADGRFGGDHPTGVMQSCQDCHMPTISAGGCFAWEFDPFFERPDLKRHTFAGSNHWVLRAVQAYWGESETGMSDDAVEASISRNIDLLRAASDVLVSQVGSTLKVRVVNWSGHKLPSGYPEGRRMWLNVRFYDEADTLVEERGAYDYGAATLDEKSTKVYLADHGMDENVAALTNLPEGKSFHLALNNVVVFDNRIPPMGFTNAAFAAFGGGPIGYAYADGQHWDDTEYEIPAGAVTSVVTLYYQVTTREYMEFLRDRNTTNHWGQTIYDLWDDPAVGNRAPPVDMDVVAVKVTTNPPGDLNGDGSVDFEDVLQLLAAWGPCPGPAFCIADLDCDGDIDFSDLLLLLGAWTG